MGELLLCQGPLASIPFTMESDGRNLYSLEELCYYIMHNIYFLEKDFMSDELCTWISSGVKNEELGNKLRELMREDVPLSLFIATLLSEVCYNTKKEIAEVVAVLKEMESKSDFEVNKIRADRLQDKKKYMASIFEYQRLIEQASDMKEMREKPELFGNLWHNLGTAYAKLFLFREASEAFEKAYTKNRNRISLKHCLFCYRCIHDEAGFTSVAEKYGLSEIEILELRNELTLASRNEAIVGFETKLEALAEERLSNSVAANEEIERQILTWKDDYRRICRK